MKDGPIVSFSGEYRFLSNFYPSEVLLDGRKYVSVEHAYQAAKISIQGLPKDEANRLRKPFIEADTPAIAKKLGRQVRLRDDWESVKVNIMVGLLRQKFHESPLKDQLLATGDRHLEEGNHWGDRIWGTVNGVGKNYLGKSLMLIRYELVTKSKCTGNPPL